MPKEGYLTVISCICVTWVLSLSPALGRVSTPFCLIVVTFRPIFHKPHVHRTLWHLKCTFDTNELKQLTMGLQFKVADKKKLHIKWASVILIPLRRSGVSTISFVMLSSSYVSSWATFCNSSSWILRCTIITRNKVYWHSFVIWKLSTMYKLQYKCQPTCEAHFTLEIRCSATDDWI